MIYHPFSLTAGNEHAYLPGDFFQCHPFSLTDGNKHTYLPGDVSRVMTCAWTSENQHVVLEVPDPGENTKSTSDSDRSSWNQLLQELEEEKVTDPTINSHELLAPVTDGGAELSSRNNFLEIGPS